MRVSVEIKTHGQGKFCSARCRFFGQMVVSDLCTVFGSLKRVKKTHKIHFISYRHRDCVFNQIKESQW